MPAWQYESLHRHVAPERRRCRVLLSAPGPNPDHGLVESVDLTVPDNIASTLGHGLRRFDPARKITASQELTVGPRSVVVFPSSSQRGRLYWCDREGMRLMRANLDGSNIETLVDSSDGDPRPGPDATKWCVGVAIDVDGGKVYWTQKGPDNADRGRLFRAGIEVPTGQTAANRADIEVLYDGLPEPIDLELDLNNRVMYWTDRGDPPRGNTVNRAPMDSDKKSRPAREIVLTHLMEGIGIALDLKGDRMFITDLGGNILSAKLHGSDEKALLVAQGNLTGIAYAEIS